MEKEQTRLVSLYAQLLSQSDDCVQEVKTFIPLVENRLESNQGGLRSFLRDLEKEQQKLRDCLHNVAPTNQLHHSVTSLQHHLFQWNTLKRGRCFVAINQTFQGLSQDDRRRIVRNSDSRPGDRQALHRRLKSESKVAADVLAWGSEWVSIRWISQNILARHMTDSGWCWGYQPGDAVDESEWRDTLLARHVDKLVAAARANRCEYQPPRIRLVLPNIDLTNQDISVFFEQIRSLGPNVTVETRDGSFLRSRPPSTREALRRLAGDETEKLTATLNLDHSVLIDLISDLTHFRLQPQPWQSLSTRQQIEEELSSHGLMAQTLYPLLLGRKLVCTREAAAHLHEMLKTVGTDTERQRGHWLVPPRPGDVDNNNTKARDEFAALSVHPLPADVQIPVHVMEEDWTLPSIEKAISDGMLPRVARDVAHRILSESKRSVFLYGWAAGITTLTSNKEIRAQMKTLVETYRYAEEETGPQIWKMSPTRNLLSTGKSVPLDNNLSVSSQVV